MSNSKPNIRYDADGRAHNKSCGCTLKKPRTVNIDADGPRLRKVAEEIFVHKTRKDLGDDDRADMRSIIHLIDGDLPVPHHDHPAFWAGIFLGALRRHESRVAMDAARAKADAAHKADLERQAKEHMDRVVARAIKGTSATVGARKNEEQKAKEAMQRESREAWRAKKTK